MNIDPEKFQAFLKEKEAEEQRIVEEAKQRIRAALDRRRRILNLINENFFPGHSLLVERTNLNLLLPHLKKKFDHWRISKLYHSGYIVEIWIEKDGQTQPAIEAAAWLEGEAFALAALKTKGIFVD